MKIGRPVFRQMAEAFNEAGRLRELRLPDRRPAHHARHARGARREQGQEDASAFIAPKGLRHLKKEKMVCPCFLLAGCAAVAPLPPGMPAFALMGDAPYSAAEVERLDSLIDDLNRQPLAFIAHVGDITSGQGPCSDEWFEARKQQFARLRAPFVLLPGDNDWTDCHRTGFEPMERLAKWRELFCHSEPVAFQPRAAGRRLLRAHPVAVPGPALRRAQRAGQQQQPRPQQDDGRRATPSACSGARMGERFRNDLPQEKPERAGPADAGESVSSTPIGCERLRQHPRGASQTGTDYPGRVVLVNGDTHTYRDDEPLPSLRRIEVYGSPLVGWLRGSMAPSGLRVEPAGMQ